MRRPARPSFGVRVELLRRDRRAEIVLGDVLQDLASRIGHLGAFRHLGSAAQMTVGDGFDNVPFGVGVEGFLDVRCVEQLEDLLYVLSGFRVRARMLP